MTARQPRCAAPKCGRPAHNGQLCTGCAEGLGADLLAVRPIWADLTATLTRQDHLADRAGSGTASPPLPWNERASQARAKLAATVRTLDGLAGQLVACDVRDHRCEAQARAEGHNADPVPLARWLWRRIPDLVLQPGIGPRARDLDLALRRARTAVDRPQYDRRFLVGPCPRPGETATHCPGEVWALIPTRESDPSVLRCRTCGHEWGTIRWLRAGREIRRRQAALGHLDQRVKGRQLISRATLLHVTGRAQSVITKHCAPVLVDPATRTQLYDAEIALDALAHVPTRRRSA